MLKNKLARSLLVMFICFTIDSLLRFYLPHDPLKVHLTIVSYVGIMMFNFLNNDIDEERRYFFALICGIYYSVIYGNSVFMYALLFLLYAFIGKEYMKKATFTYFEAFAIVVLTIFIQESVLYLMMWITGATKLAIMTFVLWRLLPTLLFNAIVFNVVYFIHDKIKLEGDVDVYFS
ncbi:MAG: hypothetical protein ACI4SR_03905 [Faecalibacillus sp.]